MKKLMALFLAAALALSLFACSSSGSNATTSPSGTSASPNSSAPSSNPLDGEKEFVIGFNNMMAGAYPLDIMQWASEKAYGALGMRILAMNDESNPDKSLSNLQNMIASGVDAISYQPINDAACLSLMEICEGANVPFIIRDAMPTDPDIYETITNSPMFIGFAGTSNQKVGETMAKKVIEAGYEKGLIIGIDRGQPSQDGRINAFWAMAEDNGITIQGEARPAASSSEDMTSQSEDLIGAHRDCEFIYSAFGDTGCVSADACALFGISPAIYVADITPTVLEYLADGDFVVGQGAGWVQATWEAALVYNFLTGHQMLDDNGKPMVIDSVNMITVDPKGVDLYQRFWLNQYIHDDDYIRSFTYEYNPDLTLDYFIQEAENYSFDSCIKDKVEQGLITAEEAAAAGVEIN